MMATDTDAILKALKDLGKTITEDSKMDMFPSTSSDKINDSMDRTLNDILHKMDAFQKKELILSKKQLAAANKILKEKGLGSGKESSKDLALKLDQAKAMRYLARQLKKFEGNVYDTQEELDKELEQLEKVAAKANLSMEDLGITTQKTNTINNKQVFLIKNVNKKYTKLDSTSGELLNAFEEITEESKDLADKMDKSKTIWGKVGDAIKYVTGDFIKLAEEERRYAQQTATADAGWIKGLMSMRISTLDYMKILKETRIENLAMTASGKDFTASLIASQDSLVGFTKDSTEAAQVAASFHKSMSRIGVSQNNLGDAIDQQSKIYKENYRVLGYTAEEFSKLSDELINTQGMRSVLLGLQEKERKQYVLGIQQRMAEYQTMGYTIERAKELQATFQALNGMNPKERMKQAAKTRAMMGAMGMGKEGAELFDLQTRYRTMDDTDKLKADKRMTEIQGQASGKFGQMSGSGSSLGQSMAMQMMADRTGFTQIAEKFETASGEGLKISQDQMAAMKKQAKHNNEVEGWQKELLKNMDGYNAAEKTALGTIATNAQKGMIDLGAYNAFGFAMVKMGVDKVADVLGGESSKSTNSSSGRTRSRAAQRNKNQTKTLPANYVPKKRIGRAQNRNKKNPDITNTMGLGEDIPVSATPTQTIVDTTIGSEDATASSQDGQITPSPQKDNAQPPPPTAVEMYANAVKELQKSTTAMQQTAESIKEVPKSFDRSTIALVKHGRMQKAQSVPRGTGS